MVAWLYGMYKRQLPWLLGTLTPLVTSLMFGERQTGNNLTSHTTSFYHKFMSVSWLGSLNTRPMQSRFLVCGHPLPTWCHILPIVFVYCRYRTVPDHDISCVTIAKQYWLCSAMLQVPILGGMLKEGPQDRHLFHAAATLPISHTHYFQLRLSVHAIQKASCFLI